MYRIYISHPSRVWRNTRKLFSPTCSEPVISLSIPCIILILALWNFWRIICWWSVCGFYWCWLSTLTVSFWLLLYFYMVTVEVFYSLLACYTVLLSAAVTFIYCLQSLAERHNWTFCRKCRAQDKVAGHGATGSTAWWWALSPYWR